MAKSSSYLPEDIITEILLRLPVKSLLRFQTVSKLWLFKISDSKLIRSHCHIAAKKKPKLLVSENLVAVIKNFEYIFMSGVFPPNYEVIGSCNGIVCISNDYGNQIYLWNPSIKKYKRLPPTINNMVAPLGFGYDSISDDYKVVVVPFDQASDCVQLVQLFSSNACSWREIPVFIPKPSSLCCFVNGVLYFEVENEENKIISFDLHLEVFKVVILPTCVLEKRSNLLDFEGSLAIITVDYISDGSVHQKSDLEDGEDGGDGSVHQQIDLEAGGDELVHQEIDLEDGGNRSVHRGISLWMLEEGCEVNWIKKFMFEADLWVDLYLGAGHFYGESCSVGGDNTSYQISSHIWYDNEKEKCNYFHLQGEGFGRILRYTESLVSFKGFESTACLLREQSRELLRKEAELRQQQKWQDYKRWLQLELQRGQQQWQQALQQLEQLQQRNP